MSVELLSETIDQLEYNQCAPHPLQSWEWGEARKKTGLEVLRIGEFSDTSEKKLLNIFQMTLHLLPYTSYKIGYIPRSVVPTEAVLKFLKNLGKEKNLLFIKFEPNEKKANHSISTLLRPSPHPLFPAWTMVLDLEKNEDQLLADLKSKTRYNIRLAQKKGVVIKEMSNTEGFEIFIKLYFETCKRQKYFGHTKEYHQIIWETLQHNIAHILVAFYQDVPLAAYELFFFNDTFYYPYGGSSIEHRNVMGANLLMWEAILLGKSLGAKSFDMWGALAPGYDEKNPWAGFTRFKEGYNAQFVEMLGSYDLVMNSSLYQGYSVLHKLRSLILPALS